MTTSITSENHGSANEHNRKRLTIDIISQSPNGADDVRFGNNIMANISPKQNTVDKGLSSTSGYPIGTVRNSSGRILNYGNALDSGRDHGNARLFGFGSN